MSGHAMSVSVMSGPGSKVQLQLVRAFTDQPQGGNPAGVIIQGIARDVRGTRCVVLHERAITQ